MIAQLDLALTTNLPRFAGVLEDDYFEVLEQKGISPAIVDILRNLEKFEVCDDQGNFDLEQAKELVIENSFGSIWGLSQIGSPAQNYDNARRLQEIARSQSASKLPLLIIEEGLHGVLAPESTIFPQSIALAASFDPSLVEDIGYAIGQEARLRGANALFSPVLDIALDARWGRSEETFGADPHIVKTMGAAMVRGLRRAGIAPIAKHFCGHGSVRGGRDSNDDALSIRELRTLHLPAFKAAIDAGALGIMSAYNAIDGLPCTANSFLLKKILREEWGFKGLTISDAGSIEDLHRKYAIVGDFRMACQIAFLAGLEIHNNGPNFQEALLELLEEGTINHEELELAVGHVLYVKEQLGLLDIDQPDPPFNQSGWLALRNENRRLAQQASQSCLALLKNEAGILPITPTEYSHILICGPLAGDGRALLGDYCLESERVGNIYDEICTVLPEGIKKTFSAGCPTGVGGEKSVDLDRNSELEATLALAEDADLVIFIGGESSEFGVNALSGEGCDRASIELPMPQRCLIQRLAECGKPLIGIVITGRALALENEVELLDALLYCLFPGEGGAVTIAETLIGELTPQGHLPFDLPRQSGQLPLYYHQYPSGRSRDYCDLLGTPLYPFGYGMSYTRFDLYDLQIDVVAAAPQPEVNVFVRVRNTGDFDGPVLVQIYCQDIVSSVLTPEKKLCAFEKQWLEVHEECRLEFQLGFDAFALLNSDHSWCVEPGEFEISVGFSANDMVLTRSFNL